MTTRDAGDCRGCRTAGTTAKTQRNGMRSGPGDFFRPYATRCPVQPAAQPGSTTRNKKGLALILEQGAQVGDPDLPLLLPLLGGDFTLVPFPPDHAGATPAESDWAQGVPTHRTDDAPCIE